jgi:hypothetical protein
MLLSLISLSDCVLSFPKNSGHVLKHSRSLDRSGNVFRDVSRADKLNPTSEPEYVTDMNKRADRGEIVEYLSFRRPGIYRWISI